MSSQRDELRKLILYYGSHRIFYRLAEMANAPQPELEKFRMSVRYAEVDIERELNRLGVPQ